MNKTKPFSISKQSVWRAYERVKANSGAAGVDKQTIEDFDKDLKGNLYKLWNRMSSGSYFPMAVRTVAIPKKDGGERKLGIPTVADRIAQMVVKMLLEPLVDPVFHEDSYGYRRNKSAHQAVAVTRQRCWQNRWVIDLDIKGFFDNINHDLLMRAVKHHTKCEWVILYIQRWLKCGVMEVDGEIRTQHLGTPQGGVISPLLANLFLHYTFDVWMTKTFPRVKFERYADDIVVHCEYLKDAQKVKAAIERRLMECGLALHPEKTKIVFCQNKTKPENDTGYPTSFDFLGFTFKPRTAKGPNGKLFDGFLPGMSGKARSRISRQIKDWGVNRSSNLSIREISEIFNPTIRGWVNYYGKFYPRALRPLKFQWDIVLLKWSQRKYKYLRGSRTRAGELLRDIRQREPRMFALWEVPNE